MSGGRRYIRAPRLERKHHYEFSTGAVLCDAGHDADRGCCGDCPFAVYMVVTLDREDTAHAFIYSSTDGEWKDMDSTHSTATLIKEGPGLLLGSVLYWTLVVGSILALDFNKHVFYEIEQPPNAAYEYEDNVQVMETEGGVLSLTAITICSLKFEFHLWSRRDDGGLVGEWVLQRAVYLDELIPTGPPPMAYDLPVILGADGSVVFVRKEDGIFQVYLETSQFKRLCDSNNIHNIYPYKSLFLLEAKAPKP
ncbi:hypothetical protein BAE44_0020032 [Dichanthelium oligosanthes]|uniref:F-box protein AT5G49610-like beta-propeller domain-containing protein n=1 Tax=Dichanthelium oligosanthes TaxID=888268 RepID=A0A1E5V1C8_9POAL|nr:hypothetical protein BAE44_0020032 [Dichanthelium oligosanthes]